MFFEKKLHKYVKTVKFDTKNGTQAFLTMVVVHLPHVDSTRCTLDKPQDKSAISEHYAINFLLFYFIYIDSIDTTNYL